MEQELKKDQQSLECYAHKADVCCCWFLSMLFLGLVGWGPEHTACLAMAPRVCTLWEFCFERRLHWRFFMLNPNWSGGQDRGLFLSLGCLFFVGFSSVLYHCAFGHMDCMYLLKPKVWDTLRSRILHSDQWSSSFKAKLYIVLNVTSNSVCFWMLPMSWSVTDTARRQHVGECFKDASSSLCVVLEMKMQLRELYILTNKACRYHTECFAQ